MTDVLCAHKTSALIRNDFTLRAVRSFDAAHQDDDVLALAASRRGEQALSKQDLVHWLNELPV